METKTLYLAHHGIKGQKWGVRRYQNPDGTLTEAGKKHYTMSEADYKKKLKRYQTAKNLATVATAAGGIVSGIGAISTFKNTKLANNQADKANAAATAANVSANRANTAYSDYEYNKNVYDMMKDSKTAVGIKSAKSAAEAANVSANVYNAAMESYNENVKDYNTYSEGYNYFKNKRVVSIATTATGSASAIGSSFLINHYDQKIADLKKYWINSDKVNNTNGAVKTGMNQNSKASTKSENNKITAKDRRLAEKAAKATFDDELTEEMKIAYYKVYYPEIANRKVK